jgi:molecular chaperone GrpE
VKGGVDTDRDVDDMTGEPKKRDREDDGRGGQVKIVDRRIRFDDDAGATPQPEARVPTVVEELKARAEEAERRAREISAAYRRIDEERDAFRERLSRDLERRVDIARADLMRRIIPVLDDLDRAIAAARDATDPAPLLQGVALVRDQLCQAMAAEGVEVIDTAGRPFDPGEAEAVAIEATDDPARDSLVVEEMARGYRLRGALLRPAKVRVARRAAAPQEDDPGA